MRTGAIAEFKKPKRLTARLRDRWWIFLLPFYPIAWLWVSAVLLALIISQPIQWNHLNVVDKSYVIFQLHPYKTWPAGHPVGKFEGEALTRNLAGFLEAAEVVEVWVLPFHFQVARRLPNQVPLPPSIFLRSEIYSQ